MYFLMTWYLHVGHIPYALALFSHVYDIVCVHFALCFKFTHFSRVSIIFFLFSVR